MTPELLAHIRQMADRDEVFNGSTLALTLLDEIDRLNRELSSARLSAEEAWDAYDNVLEEKRGR